MLAWIALFTGLFVLGMAVLVALGWRLWGKIRRLGHEMHRASVRLEDLTAALDGSPARPAGDKPATTW